MVYNIIMENIINTMKMTNDFDNALKAQEQLQLAYGINCHAKGKERNEVLKDYIFCATDELHEALRSFAWRSWSTKEDYNSDRVKEELRDAFQFFLNMMLITDMTPEELFKLVKEKQQVNWNRIKNDYGERVENQEDEQ